MDKERNIEVRRGRTIEFFLIKITNCLGCKFYSSYPRNKKARCTHTEPAAEISRRSVPDDCPILVKKITKDVWLVQTPNNEYEERAFADEYSCVLHCRSLSPDPYKPVRKLGEFIDDERVIIDNRVYSVDKTQSLIAKARNKLTDDEFEALVSYLKL